jgi:G6PDH family F420-dependent oxidoreductase
VPIYVSGFGPQATELAGRIGDGYVTTMPDAELIRVFKESGGDGKPVQAGTKVCWDRDEQRAVEIAHRTWGNQGLPGQLAQTLPRPRDFMDAQTLVTPESIAESVACGDDVEKQVTQLRQYIEAGVDEVYVSQMGSDMEGFFGAWEKDVLPALR